MAGDEGEMWARKTKEAQVLSFSIIFGGAVLMGQFFHASIEIYCCVTQELVRQVAASCRADALRNRPSKLIKSKSKKAQEKTDLGPDR